MPCVILHSSLIFAASVLSEPRSILHKKSFGRAELFLNGKVKTHLIKSTRYDKMIRDNSKSRRICFDLKFLL